MGKEREIPELKEDPKHAISDGDKANFGSVLTDKESLQVIKKLNSNEAAARDHDAGGFGQLTVGALDLGKHDPFHKDFNNPNESGWESAWRGIKGIFGAHDTVEDKIREKEISNLNPEQKKQYEKEEAAYHAFMTQANINGKPPEMPMHDLVNKNVQEFEKHVREKVLSELTPEQRKELEKERRQWDEDYKKIHANDNPYGGPLYQPEPKTGPTTEYVEKMIQKRAEEELLK